jgi:hypothetical protein
MMTIAEKLAQARRQLRAIDDGREPVQSVVVNLELLRFLLDAAAPRGGKDYCRCELPYQGTRRSDAPDACERCGKVIHPGFDVLTHPRNPAASQPEASEIVGEELKGEILRAAKRACTGQILEGMRPKPLLDCIIDEFTPLFAKFDTSAPRVQERPEEGAALSVEAFKVWLREWMKSHGMTDEVFGLVDIPKAYQLHQDYVAKIAAASPPEASAIRKVGR